jgi:hypothetical protein
MVQAIEVECLLCKNEAQNSNPKPIIQTNKESSNIQGRSSENVDRQK